MLDRLTVKINFVKKRRIFGPKRDENGEWRRLHNEELHSLNRSPNIVRVIKSRRWVGNIARMEKGRSAIKILTGNLNKIKSRRLRWAGHIARMEEGRSALKILTGKPTGKRPGEA